MKKLTLLILLALFIQSKVSSQPCLPYGITFSTQAEIDSFQINYPNCTEIQGDVEISGNAITNLNGLNVLTTFWGDLLIESNNALASLTGLDNVMYVVGDLKIKDNNVLTSLTGFDNVTYIGGNLNIEYNPSLLSITSLDNLTYLGGNLYFEFNYVLTSLTGLDNLNSIGGYVYFMYNPNLASLTGLKNVTSIGGVLEIWFNSSLTSLTGLENITAASIDSLYIYKNFSLSTCEVQSICNYLAIPNGTIEIYDNAPGCNSQAEVDSACATVSLENINIRDQITIFPNPANKELFISNNNGAIINEVNIYNQIGQKVFQETQITNTFDVSMLRQGAYIIELISNEFIIREKLIIE